MKKPVFAVVFSLLVGSIALGDDWPQFRGPDRTGVSKEKGLLKTWSKGGPKLLWTFKDAGLGFSTVSVAKGVVYTLGTDMKFENEYIIALDEKKGDELWRVKIGPVFTFSNNTWGDGPRSTPTVDGNLLFALSGTGELVCVDVAKKKEEWRKNLKKDLGGEMMTKWGFSESPLVDGDLLICTPGGANGTLAALDKKTGKLVWQTKTWTETAPYSSPIVAEIHGVRQIIQTGYTGGAKGGSVAGVEAKTGKVLWSKPFFSGDSYNLAPTPIVQGNLIYVTEQNGCQLFDIDKTQSATEQYKTLKKRKSVKNNHGGVVLIDGHIYGHSDPGMWVCQELKTGNQLWDERDALKCGSGSVVAADGMLYLFSDEGEAALIEATPKGFNKAGDFKLPVTSKIPGMGTSRESKLWAHPVIANGVLYLRDHEYIFAFDVRGK